MKNKVEQAEQSASKIGKFNNADELLAAYNALESEFTKRCQLVKQLQAELDRISGAQASEECKSESDDVGAVPEHDGDGVINAEPPAATCAVYANDIPEREKALRGERTDIASELGTPETVEAENGSDKTVSCNAAAAEGDDPEADGAHVDFDELASAVVDEIARNAAAYAEMLCALPEVMDACVARYKRRLIETRVGRSPSGVAVIAPVARPRNLAEAKILADRLISK